MTGVPRFELQSAVEIPQIGLGTWGIDDADSFRVAFETAIQAGYRHFDTAQSYDNERFLGEAVLRSTLPREEFFITTKINLQNIKSGQVMVSFMRSLQNLQTDYVDLLLLHFPAEVDKRRVAWACLEEIYTDGMTKSIGVSNYTIKHLEQMREYTKIMPVVNQVELHVFLQQPELLEYCRTNNITAEAYSPLAHGKVFHEPFLNELAKKYNKSPAQIMLRWCIQQGLVVLPKSKTPERIKQNIKIFDFELFPSDMDKLKTLDTNFRTCWNPTLVS